MTGPDSLRHVFERFSRHLHSQVAMETLCAVLVVVVFLLLAGTTAVPQQCRTVHSVKNRALTGRVVRTFQDTSVEKCNIKCENEPTCYSFNYLVTSKTCQLNKATQASHPKLFLSRPDTVYFDSLHRHYHACVYSPCQNGGTCIMTSSKAGYVCSCLPRYSGDHCESEQIL